MSAQEPDKTDSDNSHSESENSLTAARLEPVLEKLPPEQRQEVIEIISQRESHSGPLPPPEQLRAYDDVLPGLAERIVRLTEKEQSHRHDTVDLVTQREASLRDRGQFMAIAALIIMTLFCGYLAWLGHPQTAGFVAVGLIAAVVGIFVTGRHADIKETEIRAEE